MVGTRNIREEAETMVTSSSKYGHGNIWLMLLPKYGHMSAPIHAPLLMWLYNECMIAEDATDSCT